jgi:hypothetical protein
LLGERDRDKAMDAISTDDRCHICMVKECRKPRLSQAGWFAMNEQPRTPARKSHPFPGLGSAPEILQKS